MHLDIENQLGLRSPSKNFRNYLLGVCITYMVLSLFGITTSSLSILTGTEPAITQTLLGKPRPIRSDEYLRSTPLLLGKIKADGSAEKNRDLTLISPLDANYLDKDFKGDASSRNSSGISGLVTKFSQIDTEVLGRLPVIQEFAARWWLSTLYLFLGLALILRFIKIPWYYSLVASVLVWTSTPAQWWSLWPIDPVGTAALSSGLLLTFISRVESSHHGGENKKFRSYVGDAFLLGGFVSLLLKLPNMYAPWSIPTAVFFFFLVVSSLWIVRVSEFCVRRILIPLSVSGLVLSLPYLYNLSKNIQKIQKTVYPGARKFTGGADFPVWSGPFSWVYQTKQGVNLNQSELAIGLLILLPISILVTAFVKKKDEKQFSYARIIFISAAPLLFWLLWILVPWPRAMVDFFGVSRFPPIRTMQILGVLVPILFVIAWFNLETQKLRNSRPLIVSIAFLSFILTIQDGSSIKRVYLASVSVEVVWLVSIATTVVVLLFLFSKYEKTKITGLLFLSFLLVYEVNPVVHGIGIFGDSKAMSTIDRAFAHNPGRWASDNFSFDSVPTGAGMRMLSGNQGLGPNLPAYELLDPSDTYIENWNRGGSYVFFNWSSQSNISFTNTSQDVIAVVINPCNKVLREFDLGWVVSSTDLSSFKCLKYFDSIIVQGQQFNIFERLDRDELFLSRNEFNFSRNEFDFSN